jgi:DNA-binding GntR family transcriptional regulator
MYLDKQHPQPVYLQLKEMLRSQIEQGYYLSHQKLPSERDLCQSHNLSRMTARKALQALIAEGFAYTRAGKGTFVNLPSGEAFPQKRPHSQGGKKKNYTARNSFHQQKLVEFLLAFDSTGFEQYISRILAGQPLETVASSIFPKIINSLEEQWQTGTVNLLTYNFAITTLRSQLIAMANAAPISENGPKALLGCAPDDQHEIGLLLLALCLRRRGYQVVYLGAGLAPDEFQYAVEKVQPDIIVLAAATVESALQLARLSKQYTARSGVTLGHQPILTFGGVAFSRNPDQILKTSGLFLGHSVNEAVTTIQQLALTISK